MFYVNHLNGSYAPVVVTDVWVRVRAEDGTEFDLPAEAVEPTVPEGYVSDLAEAMKG